MFKRNYYPDKGFPLILKKEGKVQNFFLHTRTLNTVHWYAK
jgi:hypothetical protein